MANRRIKVIHSIHELIRNIHYKDVSIFSWTAWTSCWESKIGSIWLCKNRKKTVLKEVTGADMSKLTAKTNLASLKTQINNLDINKLETVSKLSIAVDNDVVYDNVVPKSTLLIPRYQVLVD